MHSRKVRTAGTAHTDDGVALIMVLVSMVVLAMFATVALTYSAKTLKTTRHTQDSIAALAAAQAGIDDYLARLNKDDAYWTKMPDCNNIAMQKPMPTGTCPGWTPTTLVGWAPLPGVATTTAFHYDVDTTKTPNFGTINLKVTGNSNKLHRTLEVTLRRGGFGEFLYYTDYETIDPANEAIYGIGNATALDRCSHYYWEPRTASSKPRDLSYCSDIQFIAGDVLNGPTHSNDAIVIGGTSPRPSFKGTVSTSWPNCRPVNGVARPPTDCYRKNGSANPDFVKGIIYRDLIDLPTGIGDLYKYVAPTYLPDPGPGCLYTGTTRIKLIPPTVAGAFSTMTVWSPYSKTLNPGCGNPTAGWPQTMPIPNDNVIIVRNIPSGQTGKPSGACPTGSTSGAGTAALGGVPQHDDLSQTFSESDCKNGNVYVQGKLAGRLTISAENNIIITDDLTYKGGKNGADALGLIANSVKIYHPVKCSGQNNQCSNMSLPNDSSFETPANGGHRNTLFNSPDVSAAILTLLHSFTVQNYQFGSPPGGSINLFGSFAQKYRGPVGTSNSGSPVSGYLKNYEYDTFLYYLAPPYFLDPVTSSWGVKAFGELSSLYNGS